MADLPLCAAIKVGSSDPSSFLPVTENVLPTLGVVVIPGSNTCNVPGKSLPFEIAAFDAARVKGVIVPSAFVISNVELPNPSSAKK